MDAALISYRFNADLARRLVADLNDDQMVAQPASMSNHPAWTLGHLAYASDNAVVMLGGTREYSDKWKIQFAQCSQPVSNKEAYPDKQKLLEHYDRQHDRVARALGQSSTESLNAATPDRRAGELFPTARDYLVFLLATHEATHLGQLIIWRRLCDLPRVSHDA